MEVNIQEDFQYDLGANPVFLPHNSQKAFQIRPEL
jgi:hypothetical protein